MEIKKPFLAVDADLDKVRYPVICMPKLDGVRGINLFGEMVGRSLKPHGNLYNHALFSNNFTKGFDGELVLDNKITSLSLCRDTTSAVNTYEGEPELHWWLFDYVTQETCELPYVERLKVLAHVVEGLQQYREGRLLHVVPHVLAPDKETVLVYYGKWLEEGYEGAILRSPEGKHKNGRCTKNQANYLRIKPTADAEAIVVKVIEGETNLNEAKTNELGLTERSSHKENMVPNGMVGKLIVFGKRCINGIMDEEPVEFTISCGHMTHSDRKLYLEQPELIVGKTVKYKYFDHGAKDQLRMARFHSIRAESDIGE